MGSGVMDEGTRELRTSRPYLQARSCGRAGRGAGGALPGPRPGFPGPAAHGPGRVRAPSGREPAAAAAPPSLVHNLEGSCAPRGPGAAPARLSQRPSPARSEPSPAPRAPRPLPLAPPARAARASPARPAPRPALAPPLVRLAPRPPPSAGPEWRPRLLLASSGRRQRGGRSLGPREVLNWSRGAPFGARVRDRRVSRSQPQARRRNTPLRGGVPRPGVVAPGARRVGPGGWPEWWGGWGVGTPRGRAPGGGCCFSGPSAAGTMRASWRPRCRNGESRRLVLINPEGKHHAPSRLRSWCRKPPRGYRAGKT